MRQCLPRRRRGHPPARPGGHRALTRPRARPHPPRSHEAKCRGPRRRLRKQHDRRGPLPLPPRRPRTRCRHPRCRRPSCPHCPHRITLSARPRPPPLHSPPPTRCLLSLPSSRLRRPRRRRRGPTSRLILLRRPVPPIVVPRTRRPVRSRRPARTRRPAKTRPAARAQRPMRTAPGRIGRGRAWMRAGRATPRRPTLPQPAGWGIKAKYASTCRWASMARCSTSESGPRADRPSSTGVQSTPCDDGASDRRRSTASRYRRGTATGNGSSDSKDKHAERFTRVEALLGGR